MTDAEMNAKFVHEVARRTVWIRHGTDGWEAINWEGRVVATGQQRLEIEKKVQALSMDLSHNIWSYSVIVPPDKRRKHYTKATRRVI